MQIIISMERIYREMWEESASLDPSEFKNDTQKKFFGKIKVQTGENVRTGKQFFTITSGVDLFDNEEQKNNLSEEVRCCLKKLFDKYSISQDSKILAVGLGNDKITADSLGCLVADKLLTTSHIYKNLGVRSHYGNLCALKSGVSGVTGIESFDLINSAVATTKPDLIVAIDTLSCGKTERLGCTIQITDNGIEPGAGVNNPKKTLSEETLKIPVIAIGVPFVIYVRTILSEHGVTDLNDDAASLVVTSKEIDFSVVDYAFVIAKAINKVVHNR